MVRIKNSVASKKRKKKVLSNAKGYTGAKSRRYRAANEQVMHAKDDAFAHRRKKKSDYRKPVSYTHLTLPTKRIV